MRRIIFSFLAVMMAVGSAGAQDAKVLSVENIVQATKGKEGRWKAAVKDQSLAIGDRIRTRQRSRATMRLTDLYTMRLEQFTTIQLTKGLFGDDKSRLDIGGGAAFIFSREKSGEIDITTPAANGALRGTQLYVEVGEGGKSKFQVMEGQVVMANPQGKLVLEAGEAGEATPGQAPKRTAAIITTNLLQWALYYPAVLDPDELGIGAADRRATAKSLDNYREGDLLAALEAYPDRAPTSQGGKLYRSGVLLAVGRVDEATAALAGTAKTNPGRRAIERMVAAVQFKEAEPWDRNGIKTAGEAIAESYYLQSRSDLKGAREAASLAAQLAPENGFAWTRLAEMEFSFSRTKQAATALESALRFTPRNAQTHALRGFVLSADNEIGRARDSFEEAVRLDGALGNAWLGLGLTKIKRGNLQDGRADLQTAATVEPLVSGFHSYLGKAFSKENKPGDTRKELDLAKRLDPNDPTPFLYSALNLQQQNRINEAIADLGTSINLNDNRRLFRSKLLLDQDRAVRGANLARIYQNAGMQDVAVREATRAVESDYTNPSAHLFLANSFNALRDPRRIALRYETPWFNELLLSNLLSPVGGGPLSQFVSQQEYSRLLEADGIGGSFTSEWRSNAETRSNASIFGTSGNLSYGLDAYYRNDSGDRFNSEADLREIYGQLKWQVTPDDVFYFLGKWADQQSGDNFETFDNLPLAPGLNFTESQEPGLLLAGWNHRWAPGSHTLVLVGRLAADQTLTDDPARLLLIERDAAGLRPGFIQQGVVFDQFTDPALRNAVPPAITEAPGGAQNGLIYSSDLLQGIQPFLGRGNVLGVTETPASFATQRSFEIYTAEVQQILQNDRNLIVAGGRFQTGKFQTESRLSVQRPNFSGGFATPAASQSTEVDFQRMTLYGYDYWKVTPALTLIGGFSLDRINHPDNFRNPPVNSLQREEEHFAGKFGFRYSPSRNFTVRGVYTEGLGGVTFDESVRLEPVQLAGFNQAYRTVISESLAGSVETPTYKIWGLSVEGRLPTRTWWGVDASVIEQDVDRTVGVFTGYDSNAFPVISYFPDSTSQNLDYREVSVGFNANQLIGDQFSVGVGYRGTKSDLRTTFPGLAGSGSSLADLKNSAYLHQVSLNGNWNSPTGLFGRVEANWYAQDLDDDPRGLAANAAPRSGDDFLQFNALIGYRFKKNMCEISAGILNITDTDYQLSPISPYGNLARERTAVIRCRFSF